MSCKFMFKVENIILLWKYEEIGRVIFIRVRKRLFPATCSSIDNIKNDELVIYGSV